MADKKKSVTSRFNFSKGLVLGLVLFYFNHPALRITARAKNKIRHDQVALFNVDSALLALENIELPLDANPPIPSPLGLCRRTNSIRKIPEIAHAQDKSGMIIFFNYYAG